ncbi:Crinkler (CRN) family protein [Phytophthora infestans T30-4]|uniref:Crinkler (CRN) family protein n=1 Tax=Phytophthora infestans (strain T30-4) TaxID=403677 RepID=D0NEG4_PHYIT|nr:Crinkler (CRN) family protein [Phytophthora infestans T30-4]EEY56609.1 Crinkler (CRN) family protein [Phytophthora infestans T30-4]|eukprot:XP_002902683.1 Crinkler (CRN) family protein [Phytophthora infestans T30-4]
MVELLLFCWVVGQEESGFNVAIRAGNKVTELTKAIKTKSGGAKAAPWPTLQLFLAKHDGVWLNWSSVASVTRDEFVLLHSFEGINPILFINSSDHFGEREPGEGQVNVLVVAYSENL